MRLSQRTNEALQTQLMREIEASYLYLSMAGYCESLGLAGFAKWLHEQSSEEWTHAMKFRAYIDDRGERVTYGDIGRPDSDFSSISEVFEKALENEVSVSAAIADLYSLAEEEKDLATQAFLDWFVTEQVEEEKSVQSVIDWLKRIGDSQQGLYLLDKELGGGVESGASTASGSSTGGTG
ncbi:MAG: ferritin [Actinomycetota bacterium]